MNDFTGGPGFLAFVFTFALAIAAVLLSRSLTKHLRGVKAEERRQAEQAARAADAGEQAADGTSSEGASTDGPAGGEPTPGEGAGSK